jgi:ATP-binding cassette subfamily G (WHITE) protein 2
MDENKEVPVETNVTQQSWVHQLGHILHRLALAQGRSYGSHILNAICTLSCALLISAAYYDVPMTQAGTKLRLSVLFFCCVNQSLFGAMKVILSFPEQRQLMISERRMGFYTVSPYLVAFTIVDLVYTLIWPPIFALPVVFLTNLGQSATKFFGFVLMLYLDKICATALALMVVSVARSVSVSVVVLPMAIEVSRLFSGYYLAPNMVPKYFVWLDPLSYVKYAFVGVALNELHDEKYTCIGKKFNATTNITTFGICDATLPTTGAQLAHKNGYDYISYGGCVGALLAYLVFMRIVSYIALRFLKH